MSGLRKWLFWGAGAAALATLLFVTFRPQPVPADLAEVTRGPMEVTIEAEGVTRIRDTYLVSAPITGYTVRSPVEVGDAVEADTSVIAEIRPAEPAFLDARARLQAEAAVVEAEAALRAAEFNIARSASDLEYAQSQYERSQALAERGTISLQTLDDAVLLLRTREAALEAAKSERDRQAATLERMQASLIDPSLETSANGTDTCCVTIRAPVTGSVLGIENKSARLVQAGEPLLEIGRPDDLELEVELLSSDAVRIAQGAPAYVERWGGPTTLEAHVRRIEPSAFTKVSALGIEEQRVRVLLDFDSPASERATLGNAFRVYIRIVEWQTEDATLVPVAALFRSGPGWAVFRLEDGRARQVPVEIGRRNDNVAQVLSGLAPGDPVILHPSDRIAPDVRILDRAGI